MVDVMGKVKVRNKKSNSNKNKNESCEEKQEKSWVQKKGRWKWKNLQRIWQAWWIGFKFTPKTIDSYEEVFYQNGE